MTKATYTATIEINGTPVTFKIDNMNDFYEGGVLYVRYEGGDYKGACRRKVFDDKECGLTFRFKGYRICESDFTWEEK